MNKERNYLAPSLAVLSSMETEPSAILWTTQWLAPQLLVELGSFQSSPTLPSVCTGIKQ